jgi:hypothetical protein
MKLVLQIALGILLARSIMSFFEEAAKVPEPVLEAGFSIIGTVFKVIALPFRLLGWVLRCFMRVCRLIERTRLRKKWRLYPYYSVLILPALAVFCVVAGEMGPSGVLSRPDANKELVNLLSAITLASFAWAGLAGTAFMTSGEKQSESQ